MRRTKVQVQRRNRRSGIPPKPGQRHPRIGRARDQAQDPARMVNTKFIRHRINCQEVVPLATTAMHSCNALPKRLTHVLLDGVKGPCRKPGLPRRPETANRPCHRPEYLRQKSTDQAGKYSGCATSSACRLQRYSDSERTKHRHKERWRQSTHCRTPAEGFHSGYSAATRRRQGGP